MTELDHFKEVCSRSLYIKDTSYMDVFFGTLFANRLDSDPVSLYLIGPPAYGKTIIAEAVRRTPQVVARDTVSKTGLLSGWTRKNGSDPSLIPRLNGKVLILKDFTAMLSMRREELHEVLGVFRAATDGYISRTMGKGDIEYDSTFGIIACVTNEIDRHRGVLAALGERFLSYRVPDISNYEVAQRCMTAMSRHAKSRQRRELADAGAAILSLDPDPATITQQQKRTILNTAAIAARARTEIRRSRFTKEPEIPTPEVPTRLATQLNDLAIGIAMARQRKAVTSDEIKLVQQCAIHCITLKRLRLFRVLACWYPDYCTCSDIATAMQGFQKRIIYQWLEDMLLLNLVERREVHEGGIGRTHRWRLSNGQMLKKILG